MINVLIAGKEFPGGTSFAQAVQDFDRSVVLTTEQEATEHPGPERTKEKSAPGERASTKQKFQIVAWNKSSPISTRSVVVHAENLFSKIDEAILFFDTAWYSARYPVFSTKDASRALDDMVAGYLHITLELLARFSKKGFGKLIFLLKEGVPPNESAKTVSLPGEAKTAATTILPATAEEAFRAFAQTIAYSYAGTDYVHVVLAHAEASLRDEEIASWLFPYLDSQSGGQKQNARNTAQWIKYGAKPSAGFSLFKHR
jgi:hypothetical protein